MDAVLRLSATEQAALIRARKITSRELMHAHLRHIALVNPRLNAVVETLDPLPAAQAADDALVRGETVGPLHGVPFSAKDSIEVEGTVCTAGTLGRACAQPSKQDATVVTRLREAGAIPIARTNLPDLLFAFESDNLIHGATNNPYDVTASSGGSSGGEAALIAACGSPLGLGSDAAGSVRVPASLCGIASIKPTSGRLPRTGHYPPAGGWIETLWQIGPMARHVQDLVTVMPLLVQPDGIDAAHVHVPLRDPAQVQPTGLRVAFYTDNGFAKASPAVAETVEAAARVLSERGAHVHEDRPCCVDRAYDLEMKLLGADGGDSLWAFLEQAGSKDIHPLLRSWLNKLEEHRTDVSGLQRYWSELDSYRREMASFLRNYDVLLAPVYTSPDLPHGRSMDDAWFRGFSYTMAFNVSGWPAGVVRCGTAASLTGAPVPVGVQIAAAPWREDIVLAVASWLEQSLGGWQDSSFSHSII